MRPIYSKDKLTTRMHSSRMRTGRSLTVCCSLLPGGGVLHAGGVFPAGGVCLVQGVGGLPGRGGSPWSGGVSLVRGGFSLLGGSAWSGGALPGLGGFSLVRGGSPWSRGGSLETPPVDRITDTCKNITLATTSLRPVTIGCKRHSPVLFYPVSFQSLGCLSLLMLHHSPFAL